MSTVGAGYLPAFAGGLVSFASPCVLPLVPAYLSIITGLEISEIEQGPRHHLGRIARDTGLFIAGFGVVLLRRGRISTRMIAIFMESLGFQPGWGDLAGPCWAASLFLRALGVVMTWFWRWALSWRVAAAAGLAAVAAAGVLTVGGEAGAATPNLRPICNERDFSLPASVGGSVLIPVGQSAADPDLDPIRLVSVFNAGANIGTVAISDTGASGPGTAALRFTLTSSAPGTVNLLWTVSDGSLLAQCGSFASNVPPPDNG